MPYVSAGMSRLSALLAERLEQSGIGARAALVPRHVQPRRLATRVLAQRVQIRRLLLAVVRHRDAHTCARRETDVCQH